MNTAPCGPTDSRGKLLCLSLGTFTIRHESTWVEPSPDHSALLTLPSQGLQVEPASMHLGFWGREARALLCLSQSKRGREQELGRKDRFSPAPSWAVVRTSIYLQLEKRGRVRDWGGRQAGSLMGEGEVLKTSWSSIIQILLQSVFSGASGVQSCAGVSGAPFHARPPSQLCNGLSPHRQLWCLATKVEVGCSMPLLRQMITKSTPLGL